MVFSGTPEYRGFELVTEKTAFCVRRSQKTNVRKHNPKPSIILIYNAVTILPPPWGKGWGGGVSVLEKASEESLFFLTPAI